MLIQFVVKNFLSFRDETIFRMTPTSDSRHSSHICEVPGHKLKYVKTAAIYGANGSGKTNLVEALSFAKRLILDGVKPKQTTSVNRFKLSKATLRQSAQFEFEILYKKHHYSYGIVLDDKVIHEEWLFVTKPKGRETKYFERTTINNKVKIEFGTQMKNFKKGEFLEFVAEGTRPEQPFLTEAELRNVEPVHDLMEWFRDVLSIIGTSAIYRPLPLRIHKDEVFTKSLGEFLRNSGTGIERVEAEESELNFEKHLPRFPVEMKQELLSDLDGKSSLVINDVSGFADGILVMITGTTEKPKIIKIHTVHKTKTGEVRFLLSEESSGTRRIVHLFPFLYGLVASEKDGVYIIDELDRSLHPLLSRLFIEFYLKFSRKKSQLIFSTHEESLLDLELLRRDEIWFIEKDKEQASHCYPLTDFKVRPDLEIRKGYLNGRFGAIPFFNNIDDLGWLANKDDDNEKKATAQ